MRHYRVSPADILRQWLAQQTVILPNCQILVSAISLTARKLCFISHLNLIDAANSSAIERDERHKELVDETAEVGLMFASKAFVQLLANPIVGPLTHKWVCVRFVTKFTFWFVLVSSFVIKHFRIGYSIPMFAGFVIMFLSTLSKLTWMLSSNIFNISNLIRNLNSICIRSKLSNSLLGTSSARHRLIMFIGLWNGNARRSLYGR